jgi:hypothetical protein
MADEPSDPNIVARLKNIPPFDTETPEEAPVETPVEEETPEENLVKAVMNGGSAANPEPEPKEPVDPEITERTKEQFEKLKEHNAELKKKLEEQNLPKKNALDSLYPEPPQYPLPPTTNVVPTPQQFPNLTPREIKDVFSGLVDSQGYVDSGLLIQTLKETDQRAKSAEEELKTTREELKQVGRKQDDFERKQVMKEVHSTFPKLDPENALTEDDFRRFDQNFYDLFQGEIMRQWTNAGSADPLRVAQKVSDILYGVKKADKEKAEAAETAKKNINATTVKPTSTASNYKDKDELISATRKGSHGALMERLNRIGQ